MSDYHVVKEEFDSIMSLVQTLRTRKNNRIMSGEDDSQRTGDEKFYGTKNYAEAETLIREGYTEILPKVKEQMAQMKKKMKADYAKVPKIRPKNAIIGYAANVPNAIQGIPESMINAERFTQKQKTIEITYIMSINACDSKDVLIKAGIALLSAINILENNRISVKLNVSFCTTQSGREILMPSVALKGYAQRLDLQKLCFPLANPSMDRRIGFRWVETTPEMTERGFNCGYGRSPVHNASDLPSFIKNANIRQDQRILSAQLIREMGYSVEKVLNFLKTNNNGKSRR